MRLRLGLQLLAGVASLAGTAFAQSASGAASGAPTPGTGRHGGDGDSRGCNAGATTAGATDAPAATATPLARSTRAVAAFAAYERALASKRLAPTEPLSAQRLRDELARVEEELAMGRRDEAISDLVYIVESERFTPFAKSPEGRSARFKLGDALGRGGAHDVARAYLVGLLEGDPERAARTSLAPCIRSSISASRVTARARVLDGRRRPCRRAPATRSAVTSPTSRGRTADAEGKPEEALAQYAEVHDRSRFWAQAT